ncbi:transmembrane 7 superfamily member 3 [Bicyclus anynana]|uniref:Transmembrane 7 superfamily member 3 n=1 Tax=Bicyclus anynana TaxID=110368 RepID=A0A6J1N9T1_BICAN|nr:transmembrane 7 superfamily member 3 [Bicyclus anynana]XP_023939806.2 transmembrane 7 superfamily member 3 [Bicyclus anynana]
MLSNMLKMNILHFILLFILAETANSQNVSAILPLNKTTSWASKELYSGFFKLNSTSTLQVDFSNVNKNVSFIIFQVHSHLYNITLYNNTISRSSSVSGSNLGMYSSVKPKLDTFYVYNPNVDVNLRLFITVHGYLAADPVPGGCNMEFPIPTSPYMRTKYTKDYVLVDAPAAKDMSDVDCNTVDSVYLFFYKMYLPERHYDADNYFDGLRKMMTMDGITEFGEYIPPSGDRLRRTLSAYPGTGAVYVAVAYSASNTSAYSVYAPTTTYACAPLDDDGCELLDDFLSQLLCASLIFFGVFLCYFGHRFFKTEMYLIGLISGVIVTYILIALIADLDRPALLGVSVLSGMCFGAIWLAFWWFYGMPLFAVMLSTLNVGFLFAAIIYFGLPGGLVALQSDLNFWTLFVSVMLLTSLMFASMTFLSNILCCAILGAYATIYPMDYYFGSNLKYIVINTVRRATVPHFNKAVLSPPFEWRDALMTLLWLALAMSGFLFQHFHNRGRPPFPPPPRSVRPGVPGSYYGVSHPRRRTGVVIRPRIPEQTERTPLLA